LGVWSRYGEMQNAKCKIINDVELNLLKEAESWVELRKGMEISELWLAQQLRPYGVRPKTIWIGEIAAKGYLKEDFGEVFRRYIPRSEVEAVRPRVQAAEAQADSTVAAEVTECPKEAKVQFDGIDATLSNP